MFEILRRLYLTPGYNYYLFTYLSPHYTFLFFSLTASFTTVINMSVEGYIGCIISVEKHDQQAYQGRLSSVDAKTNTITLSNVFINGIYSPEADVIIRATDIANMHILYNAEEASQLPEVRHQRKSALEKNPVPEGTRAPVHRPSEKKNNSSPRAQPTNHGHTNDANIYPRKSAFHSTSESSIPTFVTNNNTRPPYQSPRRENQRSRNEAFETDISAIKNTEFDFEENLKLFDKRQVADEVLWLNSVGSAKGPASNNNKPTKYKHTENVLDSQAPIYRQIKVSETTQTSQPDMLSLLSTQEYVTDTGLVVPSVTYDTRQRILKMAHKQGMTYARQMEMFGRTCSEMVMMLLGGSTRLTPENAHQQPVVVVLAGNHFQGALAANCARQLSQHDLRVSIYTVKESCEDEMLAVELALFDLTHGTRIEAVKELPITTIDMIINALDDHCHIPTISQTPQLQALCRWANQCRAPVLNIDPPPQGGAINAKWCMTYALPLSLGIHCGQVYLCDVGIPSGTYTKSGIKYRCPFANKFYIVLHPRTK